jgi:hypothetical protein
MRNLGARMPTYAVSATGKEPVPIVQEAGWASGLSRWWRITSTSEGFEPRTLQRVMSSYTNCTISGAKCGM